MNSDCISSVFPPLMLQESSSANTNFPVGVLMCGCMRHFKKHSVVLKHWIASSAKVRANIRLILEDSFNTHQHYQSCCCTVSCLPGWCDGWARAACAALSGLMPLNQDQDQRSGMSSAVSHISVSALLIDIHERAKLTLPFSALPLSRNLH